MPTESPGLDKNMVHIYKGRQILTHIKIKSFKKRKIAKISQECNPWCLSWDVGSLVRSSVMQLFSAEVRGQWPSS